MAKGVFTEGEELPKVYRILASKTAADLELQVNAAVLEGWDIFEGSFAVTPRGSFVQVVIRPKEKVVRTGI